MPDDGGAGVTGLLRKASVSVADTLINFNPQPGMWAATGAAIAQAPNLTELREPVAGGENIEFNEHGHSARIVTTDEEGSPVLSTILSKTTTRVLNNENVGFERPAVVRRQTLLEQSHSEEKHGWGTATLHGLNAAWKFVRTPTGVLMTIYGLNIVAWGAMLFFLLLGVAPAMNHPSKDAINSPRKKWLEIDSQILNALFCVTGFGLAPWRFRDLYWLIQARLRKNRNAMRRLCNQNKSWFRPPTWYEEGNEEGTDELDKQVTFTGEVAPPTSLWKLSFVIWMMVLNTLLQAVLASFMWAYNRIDRPTWATGTFIGLGCGVSMMAGVMMWWEGRKVKKIEGPAIKVMDSTDLEKAQTSEI
ncbi:hypothetical protein LSUE1_G004818 [Lachnellula suecica]|uniref:Alpha-l-rhamnosidase c n=1 Tax=Lachnellula suecica TaxID=602035 RepID=A0A8T9C902_9HELO|nr:hypothetical protein LSUE1_G004818 [Lachnellula suecica]